MKLGLAALIVVAAPLLCQQTPMQTVGPQAGGGRLLPTGWTLRPAGRQMQLDAMPMATEVTPDGRFLLVLEGGRSRAWVKSISLDRQREVGQVALQAAWLGMKLTGNGRLLYVSGGASADVYEIEVSPGGRLTLARTFHARDPQEKGPVFLGDVALTPNDRLLFVADLLGNRILVINPQSGRVIDRFASGRRPYRILFHPDGKSYFVTSWADGTLYHYETDNGNRLDFVRLGPHTTDMVWRDHQTVLEDGEQFPYRARIFVAASNTNRVYSVGVTEDGLIRPLEAIDVALSPKQPLGVTPAGLALNEDESRLFIACAEMNAVAVADVSTPKTKVLGFVPVGRYPTAALVLPDGRLVVLNQGTGLRGSASWIDGLDERSLAIHTETVVQNMPNREELPTDAGTSPIKHVIYIVKGNRTYDEVLGDLATGKGDATLTRFPENVTPNHHKLAREFVLYDNFYAMGESQIEGRYWSTASIVPDFLVRTGLGATDQKEPAAVPPTGYLWNQAALASLKFRNYGFFVNNLATGHDEETQVETPKEPGLEGNTDTRYRGLDPSYPDVDRAKVFLEEFHRLDKEDNLPQLMMLTLGNDRTTGNLRNSVAPASAAADNDYALGMIVDACSRSKSWPETAIFVVENDAEDGSDHVDPHRSLAYVLSAYTRRGGLVDSRFYNTASVLRTIELMLGLRPMTHYDAGAQPMLDAFTTIPDPSPYAAEKPGVSLYERNPSSGPRVP